jgi:hypothetical protein
VSAGGELSLEGVANSTNLPGTTANEGIEGPLGLGGAFFPYPLNGDQSTLNLVSAGGNVYLGKDALANVPMVALGEAGVAYQNPAQASDYLAIYPATVNVAALSGDIDLGDRPLEQNTDNPVVMTVFPSSNGNLTLLAQGSINNDGQTYSISLSESDPTLMPNALAPAAPGTSVLNVPLVPLYANDGQQAAIVAATGNIGSGSITMPKAADVIAGGNITDLNYQGKNLNPSDVTLISAGGDITYSTPTQPVTNALLPNNAGITLAGPGYLEVLAGGSINLGDANGIVTTGSLTDARLPSSGASLVVGAGFGSDGASGLRAPDYQAFTNAYLAPSADGTPSAYASALISYLQQLEPGAYQSLSYSQALADFNGLTPAQQLPLLAQILSDELSATGLAHTTQGTDYSRGYTAINTLFPTTDVNGAPLSYSGDLNMVFSQLKTEQGGGINLLVPGGSVIVGVPNPPASLNIVKTLYTATDLPIPPAVNLGVLVLGQGAIEGFANQSFEVNQSRMLTLEGGDIILWASNGDIDAGKGAKSASGAPPPVIETDANGNLFVDPSNAVSGSGIGQLLTTPGVKAGLVNLIAPKGAVNAGDAGIRVAGNLNIAAVEVIGAANITVAGTSTGVPVSSAGALAGALSGANSLGDASNSALQQVSESLGASTNYQQLTQSLQPIFIVVKLFCLGVECQAN